jgi:hypothetical protein
MDAATAEWMDMALWADCARLERPGYVFEIENAQGMTIQTPCTAQVDVPFDWTSPPLRFRLIAEQPAVRSTPMPKPVAPKQP